TSIQGVLTLFADESFGTVSQHGKDLANSAELQIDRLIELVNDLLQIERMESGKFDIQLEPVRIAEVLNESVQSVLRLAENHGVSIEFTDVDITINADHPRLVQVLVNLLSNAIKFSPVGGSVQILVQEEAEDLLVKVLDQGRGVPFAYKEIIFEK